MLWDTGRGCGARFVVAQQVKRTDGALFYGWWMSVGLSLTQIVGGWGVLYYGPRCLDDADPRGAPMCSAGDCGRVFGWLLASALAAVPIGHSIERHGARGVMIVGSCAALLLAAWSRVESLPALYAIWIGLGLSMSAVLYEPAFSILVRWSGQRRALALSILTSIGGFASTVFVPLTIWLTTHGSWRSTAFTLAMARMGSDMGRRLRRQLRDESLAGAARLVLDEGDTIGALARELDN